VNVWALASPMARVVGLAFDATRHPRDCGLGLVGEWVTQVHRVLIELVLGAALFSCAAPTNDGLTVESEFVLRSNLAFVHGGHRFARRYTTMS